MGEIPNRSNPDEEPLQPSVSETPGAQTEAALTPEVSAKGGIFNPVKRFFAWLKKNREQQQKNLELLRQQSDAFYTKIIGDFEIMRNPRIALEQINEEFGKRYQLSVPREDLPKVLHFDADVNFFAKAKDMQDAGINVKRDIVGLKNITAAIDGGTMSEELAHFYREHLRPQNDDTEHMTDEFFGFLGSRLFDRAIENGAKPLSHFPHEKRQPLPKKEALATSKKYRQDEDHLRASVEKIEELFGDEAAEKFEKMEREILRKMTKKERKEAEIYGGVGVHQLLKKVKEERLSLLAHQRGYQWASKVDMDKIHEWKKLFSMPNAEVRKRFFKGEPDYSGL